MPNLHPPDGITAFGEDDQWGEWDTYEREIYGFPEPNPMKQTYLVTPNGEMALGRATPVEENSIVIRKANTEPYRYLDIEVAHVRTQFQ